jgi:hypothetical protein
MNIERIAITIGLYFIINKHDTSEEQINNGRIKVNQFSPHMSVKNFTHTGQNKYKINNPKDSQ